MRTRSAAGGVAIVALATARTPVTLTRSAG